MRIGLFLTLGGSLARWACLGILDREMALYSAHARVGVQTTVVSFGGPQDKAIAARFPFATVCCNERSLHPRLYATLLPVLLGGELSRCDVLKTNQTYGAHIGHRAARLLDKPFVIRQGFGLYRNTADLHGRKSWKAGWARRYELRNMPRADLLFFTTEALADEARSRLGLDNDRICVVPNYVVPETWSPPYVGQVAPPRPLRIAFVGRLSVEKNLVALIRAAQGLPVSVTLIGGGEEEARLRQLSASLGVASKFVGRVPQQELPSLLNDHHAFVLPSIFEGHPKALIEAMAFGMPVLGADSPGIAPEIEDGRTGLLCRSTTEGLRQGLERLLSTDPDVLRGLGRAARAACLSRYSVDAVAARERSLFEGLLTGRAH